MAGAGNGLRQTYTGTKLETADTAKGSLRSFAPVLDPTVVGHLPPGAVRPPSEASLRQAIRDQIRGTFGPLLADLALAHVLGEEKWTVLAGEPVPPEFLGQVPQLKRELGKELAGLGVEEEAVRHWLGKGLEVRDYQTKARELRKRRPDFEGQCRREIAAAKQILQGGTWLLSVTLEALAADVRRVEEVALPLLRHVDRTIERLLREDVLGKGRPRALDVRLAAEGLTRLMKERTRRPRVGLVTAMLNDAGLLPSIPCWRLAPTLGQKEQAKVWCARAGKGGRACPRDPLRCALATERIETLLKARPRRKGRIPTS